MRRTFLEYLPKLIDKKVTQLSIKGYVTNEPVKYAERLNGEYQSFNIGDAWGKLFDCAWFILEGKINSFNPMERYYLKLDLQGEALLYDKTGQPVKGFTNVCSTFDRSLGEPGKIYYLINDFIENDGSLTLWVEAGCNDLFGSIVENGKIKYSEIVLRNEMIEKLYYNLETLFDLLVIVDESIRKRQLFSKLKEVYYRIFYQEPNWLETSLAITEELLNSPSSNPLKLIAVGHAHMDLAWL